MMALFNKRNFLVLFVTIIFWGCFIPAASSHSATLIAKEDFEDQNFSDFFHAAQPDYWNNLAITSYQPHSGVYSLRGNACSSCIDSITGRQGRNRTDLNFGYTSNPGIGTVFDLDSLHDNELYVRFWLKYDANFDPADGYYSNKVWWMQFEGDTDTYYVQFRGSSLSYYDEAGHTRETYSSITPDAVDGRWHLWEIYVRYNDYGQNNGILRVWFDSQEKVYYTNARFILSGGGKISRMCFGYFHRSAESSAGWQIDDIEIWDGIPDSNDNFPTIQISAPTPEDTFSSNEQVLGLSGNATDDNGIATITWVNNRGGSGTANNDSDDWTSWSVANIPLQEGENVITVTATDTAGQTGTDTLIVTYSPPGDTTPPTIQITGPTSESTYETNSSTINLIGTASDNVVVSEVTWENSAGGSGTASGATSWTIQNISLVEGENVITVTAKDSSGNTATDSITITCTVPSGTYTKTFGDSSDSDYTGTVQDTFLNINNDVNANTLTLNTYTWPTDRVANAIVMKWDLSALPTDAEIQNAILYLYLESSGGDDQYDVSVHKIINYDPNIAQCNGYTYDGTNGWTPNTQCYNNIPLAQADITQAEDTKAIDKNTGYKTWNVTQMVRDWVSDPSSNYGLLLNSDKTASADSYRYFTSTEVTDASRRPKLVITYTTVNPDTTPPTAPRNFSVE